MIQRELSTFWLVWQVQYVAETIGMIHSQIGLHSATVETLDLPSWIFSMKPRCTFSSLEIGMEMFMTIFGWSQIIIFLE